MTTEKKTRHKKDADLRRVYANAYLLFDQLPFGEGEKYSKVTKWTGVLDSVGPLQNPLLPFYALRAFGSSSRLRKERDTLRDAAKILDIPSGENAERKRLAAEVEDWAKHYDRISSKMANAEKILKSMGWKFNEGSREEERSSLIKIANHKGRDHLAECVWAIYSEQHAGKGNTAAVRRKIAAELSTSFEQAELGTGSLSATRYETA